MSDSSKNLRLLNAVIAMCRSDSKWPHYFFDLGYGVKWIEQPFICSTGDRLVPDLVITSSVQNHCIYLKAKAAAALRIARHGDTCRCSQKTLCPDCSLT